MTNLGAEGGIVDLLLQLEEGDLYALAKTVTQGLLKITSKDDAIRGILKYSPDEVSILRRKAVTREILFSYLDEKNVPVKLPITKNELIDKIVAFWGISRMTGHYQEDNSQTICTQSSNEIFYETSNEKNGVSELAIQFTNWFYSLMNGDEGIGSEHFYADARLQLDIYSDGDCDTTIIENNPEEVTQALGQIKVQHNLFFNPNVSKEGVQGRMNQHGLVMVLACGTLHIEQAYAGVFEQVFALARDPFCDNNWKIKQSHLNLRSTNIDIGVPRLCDSELTSDLLMLPSE